MDLNLHLPTLGLVLFLVFLANGLFSILLRLGGQTFRGSILWIAGQLLFALALLGLGLRDFLPGFLVIVVNNTLYCLSLFLIIHSIWVLRFKRKFPVSFYLIIPGIFLTFWLMMDQSFAFRSGVFSFFMFAFTSVICLTLLWRLKAPYTLANILTSIPFLLVAIFCLIRIIANMVPSVSPVSDFMGINLVFILMGVLAAPMMLFGYLMINSIRFQTDLKEKDHLIEERNLELVDANHSKDLFFSVIAHDLRGPIGGSARYVRKNLLEKRDILPEKRSEIEILASTLERTHEFLEKLLWWARSNQEAWVPEPVRLSLKDMVDEVVLLVHPDAEMKNITIEVSSALPDVEVVTDRECLKIIIHNLLANALKFSDLGGEVLIEWRLHPETVELRVMDFGVGLDPSQLGRLFQLEDKITSRGTRGESGNGMGLILAQSLAHRNGGHVRLESPGLGQGTTAILTLSGLSLKF